MAKDEWDKAEEEWSLDDRVELTDLGMQLGEMADRIVDHFIFLDREEVLDLMIGEASVDDGDGEK